AATSCRAEGILAIAQFTGGRFDGALCSHQLPISAGAFAASVHLEQPTLRVRVIDFANVWQPDEIAKRIAVEARGTKQFARVDPGADGLRRVPQPAPLSDDPDKAPAFKQSWSADDVILVTGGAKGFCAEVALRIGQATKAKLLLLGRSSKDDSEVCA